MEHNIDMIATSVIKLPFIPCLAAHMDPENISLKDAIQATADLWLRSLPQHAKVGPMPAGPISPAALPLRDLEPRAATLKHFFDILYDFDGRINYDQLGPILRDQAWGELPAPFGLKKPLNVKYVMQIFIRAQENGKNCIVKHIFMPDDKVKASLLHDCGYGTLYEVVWGTHAKTTKKALQFMLEQMGGVQYRLFILSYARTKKRLRFRKRSLMRSSRKGFSTFASMGKGTKAT